MPESPPVVRAPCWSCGREPVAGMVSIREVLTFYPELGHAVPESVTCLVCTRPACAAGVRVRTGEKKRERPQESPRLEAVGIQ